MMKNLHLLSLTIGIFLLFNSNSAIARFFDVDFTPEPAELSAQASGIDADDPFNDPAFVERFLERFKRDGERIVGGENVDIEDYPWQVSLQLMPQFGGAAFCGGTIIADQWILTASHCLLQEQNDGSIFEVTPAQIRIRAGFTALNNAQQGSFYNVETIITHPSYNPEGDNQFDIALLKLTEGINFDHPGKAMVSTVSGTDALTGLTDPGTMAKVSGWGALSFGGSSPNILQAVEVPIVGGTASYPPSWITPDMMLAGAAGKDACQGDSGGPLVVSDGAGWYKVAGVVSWGNGCGLAGFPGVYARVSYFEDWLAQYVSIPDPNQFYTVYYQDFAGGDLPNGWVNNVIAGPADFPGWEWTNTGGDFGGTLNSTTAGNGYMILDSDAHGTAGVMEEADLISPSVDFSGIASGSVFFSVEHLARTFGNADVGIYISSDDFATQTELYRWNNAPQNAFNGNNPVVSAFDIGTHVHGESNVKIKFKWIGTYDYWWLVDDFRIRAENTPYQVQFNVTDGTDPLEGVLISTGFTGQEVLTDASGLASLTLFAATYTISATLDGYFPFEESYQVSEDGLVINIELERIPAPEIVVDPLSIDLTIFQGNQAIVPITVSNPGDAVLDFSISALLAEGEPVDLFHDNGGPYDDAIGTGQAVTFITAARFTPDELIGYYTDYRFTEVRFRINTATFSNITVKIFEGQTPTLPGEEIYSYNVTSDVVVGQWTIHELTEILILEDGKDYWIGYSIEATGGFPAAVDTGPMVQGKGAWIFFNNAWQQLANLNPDLNFNWAIRAALQPASVSWIALDPASAELDPEENMVVDVTIDASIMPAGEYSATLNIQNNAGQPVNIPVNISVISVFDVEFVVKDQTGAAIDDAVVTLGGITNAPGDYLFEEVLTGPYVYSVAKEGYRPHGGTLLVTSNLEVEVVLIPDDIEPVTLQITLIDEFGDVAPDVYFYLEGFGGKYTDSEGSIQYDAVPGTYTYFIAHPDFLPLSNTITVTATPEVQEIEVTIFYIRFILSLITDHPDAGVLTGAGSYTINHGPVAVSATPNTGYHFIQWNENDELFSTDSEFDIVLDHDREFEAIFALNTYSIEATAGTGGSISPAGIVEVEHGSNQTFVLTADAGYFISDVLVDDVSVGAVSSFTFESISSDHTIQAQFEIHTYNVLITSEGNGTVDPTGTVTADHGSNVTVTITPDDQHHVADVLVNGTSVGVHTSYTMENITEDMALHVIFAFNVGIETLLADAIKLYPNPAQDHVNIYSDVEIMQLRIVNISGQIVRNFENPGQGLYQIDLTGIESGLYMINILTSGHHLTLRLQIKK